MNFSETETTIRRLFAWFAKIKNNFCACIVIILLALILWLFKLVHINFFYKINLWIVQQFEFNLVDNNVFTALLFFVSAFALLIIGYHTYRLFNGLFIKIIIIPSNYKHLTSEEKALLKHVFSYKEELDCQNNREVARTLEKKLMITLRRSYIGFIDDWPLYARPNHKYVEIVKKLILKDTQI